MRVSYCVDCGVQTKKYGSRRCVSCASIYRRSKRKIVPIEDRFWEKVNVPDEVDACWEWTGAINPQTGYGCIGNGTRRQGISSAHRLSFHLNRRPIKEGMLICHFCNNRKCVNPNHLYEGTYSDNLQQAYDDGLR